MGNPDSETSLPNLAGGSETAPRTTEADIQELWRQNQILADEVKRLRAEVEQVRQITIPWNWIVHPLFVLAVSLGAALAFAGYIIIDNDLGASPGRHGFYLYYMVPLAAPFAVFVLDRAARLRALRWFHWAVDLPVIILGLARALYEVPGISGHALFLTYALLTTRSRAGQVLITIVLAEVAALKLFAWHDMTLFGGMLVAGVAALLFHLPRWKQRRTSLEAEMIEDRTGG